MATHVARCAACLAELTIQVQLDLSDIEQLITEQGKRIMTALDNLKAADEALKAEVTTFLADIAGRLSGSSDAEVQAVADDINAEVAALQGGDPANTPPPPAA